MTIGIVFRKSKLVPSKPTKSRRKIKYYIERLSKAMVAKLERDRKINKRCSTALTFGHVQYGPDGQTQIKKDMWTVDLPGDKRSWNECSADDMELVLLVLIKPMPDTYVWHECRLYAQQFVSESALLPIETIQNSRLNEDDSSSSSDERDPYLPLFKSPTGAQIESINNSPSLSYQSSSLSDQLPLLNRVPIANQASVANSSSVANPPTIINLANKPNRPAILNRQVKTNPSPTVTSNSLALMNVPSPSNAVQSNNNEDSGDDIIYEGTYPRTPRSFFRRKAIEFQPHIE